MKETFIKNIIQGFNQFYNYGIMEIENIHLDNRWVLVKNVGENRKRVIIFINSLNEISSESVISILRNSLNTEEIELIRIFLRQQEESTAEVSDYEGKAELVLDMINRRIQVSNLSSEEVVQELLKVTNHAYSQYENVNRERPYVTIGLIAVNVIMYIITAMLSGDIFNSNIDVLVKLGAKVDYLISGGEYYRLVTCMFLHGGLLHLALNMYSLYSIGPLVEKIFGKIKYLAIYFISGIAASILSYMLSDGISIGASGAIFGLLGTTLIFAIKARGELGKGFLKNVAFVIAVNLIVGFSIPHIDNFAHLGGLIGGAITALIFYNIKGTKAEP